MYHQSHSDRANITLLLLLLIALINGLDLSIGNGPISIDLREVLEQQRYVDLCLFPFRIANSWLSLALFLYVYWLFGTQLEMEMGRLRYASYMISSYLFVLLATLFYPLTASYVFFSIFLAIAWLNPNMEILLFFILPMQLKWVALISLSLYMFQPFYMAYHVQSVLPLMGPFVGLAAFWCFYIVPFAINRIKNRR